MLHLALKTSFRGPSILNVRVSAVPGQVQGSLRATMAVRHASLRQVLEYIEGTVKRLEREKIFR